MSVDTLSPILQWLNANPEFSGLATFTISAAESIAIIGTIIPGTVMMTAVGTLIGIGVIPLWATLCWAILGAIAGDGISYWIGRKFNSRLPLLWPFHSHPGLLQRGEDFFRKHGSMSVFIGRFVGPVRALVPLVAGMLGMSPLRFTLANIFSAIGWAPVYMLPGILLGAVSLELPPDIATHAVLTLLAILLFIMLCIWIIHRILKLINKQIDEMLTWAWNKLRLSSYFRFVASILKHHKPTKTHGQLILAFYFLTISCVFLYLILYIQWNGSQDILVNTICLHFFRSLRTPLWDNIMLSITLLGEKQVLLPLVFTLFAWFVYAKRWHTAWHVLALGIIAAGSVEAFKLISHSPRPWGLQHSTENFSFPSGHTTLSVAFYLSMTFLLLQSFHIKSRRFIYIIICLFILCVSFSRLYLGVHWFTDVLGGWLLGTAIFMLVGLSYNRHAERKLHPLGIILTIFLTLLVTYSITAYRDFNRLKQNYTALDWPTHTISLNTWWSPQGKNIFPLYRINRFGLSTQILNLQWIDNLSAIKSILLKNGWQNPPKNDVVNILHRITDIKSAEHLPLVSPLYLDKNPVLVLTKHAPGNKKLIVLRFWQSNIHIPETQIPLWVGSVEIIPRTYSWLFKQKQHQMVLTPNLLFTTLPTHDDLKKITVTLKKGYHPSAQTVILIKPQNLKTLN